MSLEQYSQQKIVIDELQHIGFRRYSPHASLKPWVQCYWSVSHACLSKQYLEKRYPDGGASLVFNFADGEHKGGWLHTAHELVSSTFVGQVDSFGIRFHPGGAFQLLGLAINELTEDKYCLFDKLISADSIGVTDTLKELSEEQRVSFIERWLFEQAARHQPESGVVQHLWQQLLETSISIDELLKANGIGRRKFERNLRQQVGLSPNQLRQLLRVKKARQLIKQNSNKALSQIALICGYYDQAHFIRNFQKITQQSPASYRLKQQTRLKMGEMKLSS